MDIPEAADETGRAPTPREIELWHRLRAVVGAIEDLADEQTRDLAGLTITQFAILHYLRDAPAGALSMTALADGLAVSRSGMTHQIAKLEAADLVSRHRSGRDERARDVSLTETGRACVEGLDPPHGRLIQHLLIDPLEPGEVEQLEAVLTKISSRLAAGPPRSVRRRSNLGSRHAPVAE